jgi:nitrogen fixation NifU-like protein
MNELGDLYQELILEHYRRPRNFGRLDGANRTAEGFNPLCGDRLSLYLKLEDGVIEEARFEGQGCAISTASASLLTEAVKGKTESEAEALVRAFQDRLTRPETRPDPDLGKLEALTGVRRFPVRVKCATLAWHTLHAALARENTAVSTE